METPNRKVTAGMLAGAFTIILVYAASFIMVNEQPLVVPAEAASALTTLLTSVVSYFVSEQT